MIMLQTAAEAASYATAIATIVAVARSARSRIVLAAVLPTLVIAWFFDHGGGDPTITSALGTTVGAAAVHLNHKVDALQNRRRGKKQADGRFSA